MPAAAAVVYRFIGTGLTNANLIDYSVPGLNTPEV